MKKFRNVLVLMLCFLMLFSNFTFAAVQEATGTGLLSRMVRLPGEPNYHDPETGVIFSPSTGRIENFSSSYTKLPGENKYYKTGTSYKIFDPMIYSQFKKAPTETGNISSESTSGFTIFIQAGVEAGSGVGAGISGGLYISYNASAKTWTLSAAASATGSPVVVGGGASANFGIGVMNANENAIKGYSVGGSVDTPIGSVSISGSGKNVSATVSVSVGPSLNYSQNVTLTSPILKLVTVKSFF